MLPLREIIRHQILIAAQIEVATVLTVLADHIRQCVRQTRIVEHSLSHTHTHTILVRYYKLI